VSTVTRMKCYEIANGSIAIGKETWRKPRRDRDLQDFKYVCDTEKKPLGFYLAYEIKCYL